MERSNNSLPRMVMRVMMVMRVKVDTKHSPKIYKNKNLPETIRSLEDPSQHVMQDDIMDVASLLPVSLKTSGCQSTMGQCKSYIGRQSTASLQIKCKPPIAGALFVSPACLTVPFSKSGYYNYYLKQIT